LKPKVKGICPALYGKGIHVLTPSINFSMINEVFSRENVFSAVCAIILNGPHTNTGFIADLDPTIRNTTYLFGQSERAI
jgi:hypothetical protein